MPFGLMLRPDTAFIYERGMGAARGVPHAGHGALFKDKAGCWNASFFGNDRTAPFRAMPGFVPVDVKETGDDLIISPADKGQA